MRHGFLALLYILASSVVGIASATSLLPLLGAGGGSSGSGVQAVRALDLQNVVGTAEILYNVTAAELNAAVTDANYLGIKKWRDGVGYPTGHPALATLQALVNDGIRLIPWTVGGCPATVAYNIDRDKAMAALGNSCAGGVCANAVFALEGPNEPGGFEFNYESYFSSTWTRSCTTGTGPTWQGVSDYMRDWYAQVKADPILGTSGLNIPVWSQSLTGQQTDEANDNWGNQYDVVPSGTAALAAAGTHHFDRNTSHAYPMYQQRGNYVTTGTVGGSHPGETFDQSLNYDYYNNSCPSCPSRSYVKSILGGITETGYSTPEAGCTIGAHANCMPEVTAGKDLPNGLLNAYTEGFQAFCMYTLYEVGAGDRFGLFSAASTPRTHAVYFHNFITPIIDPGATAGTFAPGRLDYTLSGMPSTALSKLFEKSNG